MSFSSDFSCHQTSNFFDINLKQLTDLSNFILVTGVCAKLGSFERIQAKKCIEWIKPIIQDKYLDLIANSPLPQFDSKDFHVWHNKLINHGLEIIIRSNISIEDKGILIDGKLPLVHLHLGHGNYEEHEYKISSSSESFSKHINSGRYLSHIEGSEGLIWMCIFPVCYGSGFAKSIINSKKIIAAWGSLEDSPSTCFDALLDFPGEINNELRRWRKRSNCNG